jgi:hypothetical protein
MMPQDERCQGRVWDSDGFYSHQCSRRAIVERDGKRYCKIHDPEYKAQKNKERHEKWEREYQERKKIQQENDRVDNIKDIAYKACISINKDNPQAVADGIEGMYEALYFVRDVLDTMKLTNKTREKIYRAQTKIITALSQVEECHD